MLLVKVVLFLMIMMTHRIPSTLMSPAKMIRLPWNWPGSSFNFETNAPRDEKVKSFTPPKLLTLVIPQIYQHSSNFYRTCPSKLYQTWNIFHLAGYQWYNKDQYLDINLVNRDYDKQWYFPTWRQRSTRSPRLVVLQGRVRLEPTWCFVVVIVVFVVLCCCY